VCALTCQMNVRMLRIENGSSEMEINRFFPFFYATKKAYCSKIFIIFSVHKNHK